MTASVGHHHASVAAAAEAMAHIRRSAARPELDSTTDTAAYSVVSAEPWVEVIEQPKSTAMRFRYQCEGRSAGTILGVNATIAQKTYPSIKIHNAGTAAVVVVSCVTKDPPYYPHPHSLVGSSCKDGVCTLRVKGGADTISMMNVGIQCCKRNGVPIAIKAREVIRVDPFGTGYLTDLEKLDLSAVRLCFQVFLLDSTKKFSHVVAPAISDPIIDKKLVHNLNICRLSRRTCSAKGGDEVVLLCDKIKKDDIEVRFYEEDAEGEMIWQAFGSFTAADIHHQCAISFKAPAYRMIDVDSPVNVQIQLRRPSDNTIGEPKDFQYIPNGHDDDEPYISRKRLRLDKRIIPQLSTELEVATSTIASDAEADVLRHTVPASSSSSFNQLPLSVEQTVTDDTTQSQDRPMDYSVTSRWTQSAETIVNGNATVSRDAHQVPADVEGSSDSLPVVYLPTAAATSASGTLEEGTISLQLTEDGRLILPPGLKLYTADGQEVCTTVPADGQVQQGRPVAVEDTSNHLPLKEEDSTG